MATENLTIAGAWAKAVDAGDEFLISLVSGGSIEVAVSDTETAPSVSGHILDVGGNQGVSRTVLGPGYVYVRGTAVAAVTAWTP
jgi:hypothetical protein